MVTALDPQDFLTLTLALDMLSKYVEGELSKARQQNGNSAKQLALLNMRQHVNSVRAKLQAMEGRAVSVVNPTVRLIGTEQSKAPERCEQIKAGVEEELGRLHKTNALLIATQFAANHECEFDASDAMAAIIERVDQHIETLDRLCLEVSQ